jgi:hypothetical protein
VDIGFLEEDYSSEWASIIQSFAIPKKNVSSTIRVVTDFRKNSTQLIVKTMCVTHFPIPKIGDMIRSMEGFTFASVLDLNMGYYHIKIDADAQKLCTIVFPWHMGKYKYKRLHMGIKIYSFLMFFKTSCLSLSKIWNMLRLSCYLDDLLILTNSSFKDHLLKLEMVLARLSTTGMKVNISKSKFFAKQIQYLGYWITRQGIQPIRNEVETIINIKASKTRKEEPATPVYCYSQLLSRHVVSQK